MKQKLKGCRPLEAVNTEYSQMCGELGNMVRIKDRAEEQIALCKKRLQELDLEAGESRKQEAALKKAPAPVDEPAQPVEAPITDKDGVVYEQCTTEECKAAEAQA